MPKDKPGNRIYVATESFVTSIGKTEQAIVNGQTRVREGHELLKKFPQWFREIDAHIGDETATEGSR